MSTRVSMPIPLQNMITQSSDSVKSVRKVRRVLFGPVDHNETKRFFEREFAMKKSKDKERWDFDFDREVPLSPNGTTGRYIWRPEAPKNLPVHVMLKRKRAFNMDEDNSGCYPPEFNAMMVPSASSPQNKKQCLITGRRFGFLLRKSGRWGENDRYFI